MKLRLTSKGLLNAFITLAFMAGGWAYAGIAEDHPLLTRVLYFAFGGFVGWCAHSIWTYEIDEEEAEKEIDAMLEDPPPAEAD